MKATSADFDRLVGRAMQDSTVHAMRPVIEKELLHYDILYCLDQAGLLDHLVFQGGTSLRLCYGGNRFSEDLDFAGGREFSSTHLASMKERIEDYIGRRYGLEVTVSEPGTLKEDPAYAELNVDKWQMAITTAPERPDIPKQRIKIEVANIPAYTRTALPLRNNYTFLPDGYEDTLVYTETLSEIMADKLVSLPATEKYPRHRDIWDLPWLMQQGAKVDIKLVQQKVEDYRIDNYEALLRRRLEALPAIIQSQSFHDELKRFLPTDVFERTLGKDKFRDYLSNSVGGLLQEVEQQISGDKTDPEFPM